jgi:flagellar operon protein
MIMVVDSSGNTLNRPIITGKPPVRPENGVNSLKNGKRIRTDGFANILEQTQAQQEEIKFSRHAEFRLQSRNISLSQAQKDKMKEAVSKAESKGVRDSLVLMDDLAFVVNVRNRMVITAANSNELKENVFTNIDGAVII